MRFPHLLRLALGAMLTLFAAAPLAAQETLADLQRRFAQDRDELVEQKQGRVEFSDVKAMAEKHAKQLEQWLGSNADSPEATDGRLMLTNIYMDVGRAEDAKATLDAVDPAVASPLQLATAAEMAQRLGMDEARARWIDAAMNKDAPLEERMALAMFLMTRLVEIEKGEAIFEAAIKAAEDDEQRAEVAFHRATAISMREDLPDGSYEQALEGVAKEYPDTYWGSIAASRVQALALEVGSPAIPTAGKTFSGDDLSLAGLKGDVVLLDFWNAASVRDGRVPQVLKKLREDYGERGLKIVGINLDQDAKLAEQSAEQHGMDWPHLFDGRGWKTEPAMRWAVESVPYQILIDTEGNVAALRIFLLDDYGVQDLRTAIESALTPETRER